ncbi:MAG: hypothetical protein KJO80_04350 [Gammaproteobacteria bacterium]|nr:hypothetical protein [Gammaproteobacteria bacterium]
MVHCRYLILLFCLAGIAGPVQATPLFDDDQPLKIELKGPLSTLIDNKEAREEKPFQLQVDGTQLALKVRTRGNSRMRVCTFPPLRFNFRKMENVGTVFEGQDKLKLVTQCRKGKRSQQDVLEEYAAYRIFTLLTDVGFRVRLLHVSYVDTDGSRDNPDGQYGFLIEPEKQLVQRLQGERSEVAAVTLKSLDPEQAALVYIFQYLVGNTDWSLVKAESDDSCCHNIVLVAIDSKRNLVPFDFDLAGIVNAKYAHPDPSLSIRSVQQRLYRGFCTDRDVLRGALDKVVSRQEDILGVIWGLPFLTDKDKAKRVKYLGRFFDEASDADAMIKSFEKTCHP